MKIKKNTFAVFIIASLAFHCFAQKSYKSDTALFGELNSAYHSKSYPAVIECENLLEKQFPYSQHISKGKYLKAQSLYLLSRFDESQKVLEDALKETNDTLLIKDMYYTLGNSLYRQNKYNDAVAAFYNCAVLSSGIDDRLYYNSLKNAAFSYYALEDYANSVPLLEADVPQGYYFSVSEYEEILRKLFDSYQKEKLDARLIELYDNIPFDFLKKDFYYELTLSCGDSYNSLKQYRKAYDLYAKVLKESDSFFASIALQKAYSVAQLHPKEVGQEPGELLSSARLNSPENNELLKEFWTRLGTDSFYSGNYKKASSYFDNAEKIEGNEGYSVLIGLYRSVMQKDLSVSLSVLETYKDRYSVKEGNDYYYDYLLLEGKLLAALGEYEKALDCLNPVFGKSKEIKKKSLTCDSAFWISYCLYEKKNEFNSALDYSLEAYSTLPECPHFDYPVKSLYSRCLSKTGQSEKARRVFEQIKSTDLKYTDLTDYSKLLFLDGYVTACLKQSLKQDTHSDWYMTALSSFNKKDFVQAENYFSKYINSGEKQNLSYAKFYAGYSQYKLGENQEAYKTLTDFLNSYPNSPLTFNAAVFATNAALQAGNISDAMFVSQKVMTSAKSQEEKERAIILSAGVYSDAKLYDRAVEILLPYSKDRTDFGMKTRYEIAQLYSMQGKITQSEKMFQEIQNNFPGTGMADEAAYRRGDLYYSAGNFNVAISRFSEYQKKFPQGKFVDAAVFYTADCYNELGQTNKAIVQYLSLIEQSPESSYIYNAKKNLISIYRKNKNYYEALSYAEDIMSKYPEQSRLDGISQDASELRKLTGGANEEVVRLQTDYEKKGGSATRDGRIAGTQLCELLWKSQSTQEDAKNLAQELSSIQTLEKNQKQESPYAARTLIILAQYDRQNNENKSSAELYIKSATYFRMSGNHVMAQKALYGAVESFAAASLNADARLTYENLSKLYPDSEYAKSAKKLLNQ